jgi:hypothetical protein
MQFGKRVKTVKTLVALSSDDDDPFADDAEQTRLSALEERRKLHPKASTPPPTLTSAARSRPEPDALSESAAQSGPVDVAAATVRETDLFDDSAPEPAAAATLRRALDDDNANLTDNWDDAEGYYVTTVGDVLGGAYTVTGHSNKGVFSSVVRAAPRDKDREQVAIKILRNNAVMQKAGLREVELLRKINENDPSDKYHCVRLLGHFKHKGHLCLVFENQRCVLFSFGLFIAMRGLEYLS